MNGTDGHSINKLSEATGIDRRVLTRQLENFEPVAVEGKSKLYTLRQVIESIRGPSATAEKARLDKVRADIAEIDLAEKRQELIPIETVMDLIAPLFSNVRTKLVAIPSKAAPLLAAGASKLEIQEILKTAIYDALEDLSNTDALAILGDNAAKIVSAAAVADGEPVGGRKKKAKPRS